MPLRTTSLSSIDTVTLLSRFQPADDGVFGADSRPAAPVFEWLEDAMERAETAQTRRLIADVLGDVRALGPIDDDLVELVIGALASVDAALDLDRSGYIA